MRRRVKFEAADWQYTVDALQFVRMLKQCQMHALAAMFELLAQGS